MASYDPIEKARIDEKIRKTAAMRQLCEAIFGRNNLIGTDFDDVKAFRVEGRDLHQSGGSGIHICFTVSWHAIGKLSPDSSDPLKQLGLLEDED